MIRSVEFTSEKDAIARAPRVDAAMLSISNPGIYEVPLQPGWQQLKRCYFPDAGCDDRMIEFIGGYDKYLAMGFFNHVHAMEIRQFVDALRKDPNSYDLIIHCHAGKSRSVAVAKYVSEICGLPFDHSYDRYNHTVYELLHNPLRYAPPGFMAQINKPVHSPLHRLFQWLRLSQ